MGGCVTASRPGTLAQVSATTLYVLFSLSCLPKKTQACRNLDGLLINIHGWTCNNKHFRSLTKVMCGRRDVLLTILVVVLKSISWLFVRRNSQTCVLKLRDWLLARCLFEWLTIDWFLCFLRWSRFLVSWDFWYDLFFRTGISRRFGAKFGFEPFVLVSDRKWVRARQSSLSNRFCQSVQLDGFPDPFVSFSRHYNFWKRRYFIPLFFVKMSKLNWR